MPNNQLCQRRTTHYLDGSLNQGPRHNTDTRTILGGFSRVEELMKNQGDKTTVVEGMMMTEAEGEEWDTFVINIGREIT